MISVWPGKGAREGQGRAGGSPGLGALQGRRAGSQDPGTTEVVLHGDPHSILTPAEGGHVLKPILWVREAGLREGCGTRL